ncbi:MAG: hypothetical protein CSB47_08965 [Proteobacteria bacterium]|nr:MAG: hypothetical protein CSB47_08965 [Pseudomonadota bacterium]
MTEIKQEQVTTLYRATTLGFWGNLLLAAVLSFFLIRYDQAADSGQAMVYYVVIWLALLTAACFYRLNLTRQFNPNHYHDPNSLLLWANKHILLTTIINTIWGVAGFILLPDHFPLRVLMSATLFGVLLMSIPILIISLFAYSVQLFAILAPILVSLLIKPDYLDDAYLLPVSILILAGTLFAVSEFVHRMLMELRDAQSLLKEQANTDALTQLANRRAFDQTFKNEWRRTIRDELPISMLLVDVDHFAQYNESQGQRAGDNCLKAIASSMEVVTRRPADIAARYSDEEFAVLLPNTTLDNAIVLGERLRTTVEQLQIPHPASKHGVVTVSVGVACCTPEMEEEKDTPEKGEIMFPAMLINAADNALFLAKQQGCNRVAEQKCGEQRLAFVLQKYAKKEDSRT